jgi:para-aminobenzoate synthetase component 1
MQRFQIPSHLSLEDFKAKALAWAKAHSPLCYLDNNAHQNNSYHRYEMLLGVGAKTELKLKPEEQAWQTLQDFKTRHKGSWLLGYLSYELKDELEKLSSQNPDDLGLPLLHFFVPKTLLTILTDQRTVELWDEEPENLWQTILSQEKLDGQLPLTEPKIKTRISKETYLAKIEQIKNHIIEGDIYEMNFCQEFFAASAELNAAELFWRLNALTQSPFACYYQSEDYHLLSASPERFLFKEEQKLVSQPIKGTIKRGESVAEDAALQAQLLASEKDRAENVMIVDLVRNDLARVCEIGSVEVEELFGIYGFNQVFQMISTVIGELREELDALDAIKAAFPMGSMTGAPKVMSMKLIEALETRRRGLYSGAVGYFNPQGDFDFNVVIRSLLYNESTKYLSFQVGGAIVYDSDPEAEYEECLLKAKGMLLALGVITIV